MNLGELEKILLKYFWQVEVANAKQVHAYFEKQRGGSLNTIQSTLDRLYKKGLLKRKKQSHAYQYRAALQRSAFIGRLIKEVAVDFSFGDEYSLIAEFVSLSTELNEEQLDTLDKLIKDYRSKTLLDDRQ